VVFTDLQIFNKNVSVNEEVRGKVVLKKAISETSEIVLKYSDNVFSVEFAALNFLHPEKVKYIYRLKGFNKTWLTTDGSNRRITYTNLNPGEYYFIVKASNNDGLWNGQEAQLKITVLPPFWKSNFAIVLYLIFVAGLLFILRWLELRRARMNYRNEQELQEAQRRHDMDMMKIKFFTNVSHEFRTPLTLIISPLEQMLKKMKNSDQEKQLALVYRNARRLLNLVNQLLDFRKMEVDEIKLHPTFGDIIQFLKETTLTFSDISEKKDIHLSFYSSISGFNTLFDHEKLERTLFNLLSNAFKFTPSKGSVAVEIELEAEINGSKTASEKIGDEIKWLIIKVKDTGIGISEEKHEQIFERFFQNDLPGSLMNQGSGIGLALTREYVKLQGGTIAVESAPGKGSCFTLHLPFNQVEKKSISEEVSYWAMDSEENINETSEIKGFKVDKKKPLILIVEDNEDFRFYLKDNLKQRYNILEAENGEEGWERILSYMPDLIVSDIMMPEMDGIDLCHRIKTDRRTFDIPVILLTARITDEQKLEGFEHGADEYITKPFSFEILEARIKNLIAQRQNLRKSYQ
ncbi:MAG: response regulator, partial [Bacteroidota bacterium]|nr:response regulator [Bacteroidota bacterium]